MSDLNKRVLRRLFDEVIKGPVIDELFAPDYVNHGPFPPDTPDLASIKKFFAANPAAFPDMRVELKDVIAEGDLAAYRAVVTEPIAANSPASSRRPSARPSDHREIARG